MTEGNDTKERIYQTAKRLFFYEGYDVGSRKIAHEANANQGLITYYFGLKEHIAIRLLTENYKRVCTALAEIVDPKQDLMLFRICYFRYLLYYNMLDKNFGKFFQEVMQNGVYQKFVETNEFMCGEIQKIIKTLHRKPAANPEKTMAIFTSVLYGVITSILPKINGDSGITPEDALGILAGTHLSALAIPYSEEDIIAYLCLSQKKVAELLIQKPEMTDPEQYLFQPEQTDEIEA